MSISSSLYIGMSSLFCLGDKMGTLGDNIANVNTTGFKANQLSFEDILFEATNTGGVRLSPTGIKSDFSEGSVQSDDISTHMAISGDGFFILRDSEDTSSTYYTRAGEFSFDSEGYLVNPAGHIVQGYQFNSDGTEGTTLADIQLQLTTPAPTIYDSDPSPQLVSIPKASTRLTLISNLDASGLDNSPVGLFDNWDGTQEEPISSNYEYRVEQDIYDSSGDRHSIVVYYDRMSQDNTWEYLITSLPQGGGTNVDDGVCAKGTITFNSNGYISDMTLDNYNAGAWIACDPNDNVNGYLTFTPFAGAGNIEFDMGTRFVNGYWQNDDTNTTTQHVYESYTTVLKSDGYGEGDLAGFSISSDGIIRADFENDVTTDLFRVGLANSLNPSGCLQRIGSTLYKAEPESAGSITVDIPGSSGIGMIMGSSLENSNVDLVEQFGDLIFTQRTFQANSKSMVTADEMLKTLIALKR